MLAPEQRGLCAAAADEDLAAVGLPVGRTRVDGLGCGVVKLQPCGVDDLSKHPHKYLQTSIYNACQVGAGLHPEWDFT